MNYNFKFARAQAKSSSVTKYKLTKPSLLLRQMRSRANFGKTKGVSGGSSPARPAPDRFIPGDDRENRRGKGGGGKSKGRASRGKGKGKGKGKGRGKRASEGKDNDEGGGPSGSSADDDNEGFLNDRKRKKRVKQGVTDVEFDWDHDKNGFHSVNMQGYYALPKSEAFPVVEKGWDKEVLGMSIALLWSSGWAVGKLHAYKQNSKNENSGDLFKEQTGSFGATFWVRYCDGYYMQRLDPDRYIDENRYADDEAIGAWCIVKEFEKNEKK